MAIHIPAGWYLTVKQFARISELSEQTVKRALKEGRIAGALQIGINFIIPAQAVITGRGKQTHGRYVGLNALNRGDLEEFKRKRGLE